MKQFFFKIKLGAVCVSCAKSSQNKVINITSANQYLFHNSFFPNIAIKTYGFKMMKSLFIKSVMLGLDPFFRAKG